jgi:hypothetical protein
MFRHLQQGAGNQTTWTRSRDRSNGLHAIFDFHSDRRQKPVAALIF